MSTSWPYSFQILSASLPDQNLISHHCNPILSPTTWRTAALIATLAAALRTQSLGLRPGHRLAAGNSCSCRSFPGSHSPAASLRFHSSCWPLQCARCSSCFLCSSRFAHLLALCKCSSRRLAHLIATGLSFSSRQSLHRWQWALIMRLSQGSKAQLQILRFFAMPLLRWRHSNGCWHMRVLFCSGIVGALIFPGAAGHCLCRWTSVFQGQRRRRNPIQK